jgi:hypothetical protein
MNPGLIELLHYGGGDDFAPAASPPDPDPVCPNMSRVCGDLAKIMSGPCALSLNGESLGHTLGGMKFSAVPDLRVRMVDVHGTMKADLVYQGDSIDVTVTLMQWMAKIIRLVYQWGALTASYVGVGPRPGRRGQDIALPLLIHPLAVPDGSQDVLLFRVIVDKNNEVTFGTVTSDRLATVTFTALVDETDREGLLGRLGTGG